MKYCGLVLTLIKVGSSEVVIRHRGLIRTAVCTEFQLAHDGALEVLYDLV